MVYKERSRKVMRETYSYTISLPINWVRNRKIKQGDIIEPVIQDDGNLLLVPKSEEKNDEQTETAPGGTDNPGITSNP